MFKSTSKTIHFRSETGSSSVRAKARGYGGKSQFGKPIKITSSLVEQYVALMSIIEMQDSALRSSETYDDAVRFQASLRALVGNANDMWGMIKKAGASSFANLIVFVARRRLPADQFSLIVDEAKDILKGTGEYGIDLPQIDKLIISRSEKALSRGNWRAQLSLRDYVPGAVQIDALAMRAREGMPPGALAAKFGLRTNNVIRILDTLGIQYDFEIGEYNQAPECG